MKLISIQPKSYTLFILLLFVCIQGVYSQHNSTLENTYFRIVGAGLSPHQQKDAIKGKQTTAYTIGGFVNIYRTYTFDKPVNELYYRKYFKGDEPKSELKKKAINFQGDATLAYLNPNQEFIVELLDQKMDTLVSRYVIKRLKLIPTIQLKNKQTTSTWTFGAQARELKVSADENLTLGVVDPTDFKGLEVSYSLTNLKTKRTERKTSKNGFEPLKLTANTQYELRVNYALQPESVGIIYIQVKPYWYQSSSTYIIFFGVVVALAFLFVTLGLKKKINLSQRKQKRMEETAIRLQSLLNPHFTFNALSSIQGLMNTGRIDEANHYLQEFSSLLRQTLAKSKDVFNSLDQELEMMRMYMRLESLRFNFSWAIEIADSLNPSVIEIPTLLLQPLIENSIKHGLSGLGDKGNLLIVCKEGQKKDTFVIVVKDNGTWVDQENSTGYGLSLTAERILTINKMKKEQAIALDFNRQNGTEAILTFHNWIND